MNYSIISETKLISTLSFRNLWRQRRRNSILLVSIVVAVAGVIVLNGLIRGMQVQMVDQVIEQLNGHIKIQAPGYRDDPSMKQGFSVNTDEVNEKFSKLPLLGWTSRIQLPGVVWSEREARGVQLVGLDPKDEEISFVSDLTIEGEFLTDTEDVRVVIGRSLLNELRTRLGHRIVVVVQDIDGQSTEIGYRIAGVYDTDSKSIEKSMIFVSRNSLQQWLRTQNVTEISVRFDTRYIPPHAFDTINHAFPNLLVRDWMEMDPIVSFMHRAVNSVVYVWLGIVLTALVFGLSNTFITAVMERTHEFGLFQSIGMKSRQILVQVILESFMLMIAGTCGGLLLSWLIFSWIGNGIDLSAFAAAAESMNLAPRIVPAVLPLDVVIVVITSLLLSLVASLYPAIRAVRTDVLVALRS